MGQAGQRGAGDARREQLAGGSGEKGRGARATCVRWASALAGPERAGGGRAGQAGGGERCAAWAAGEGEGDGPWGREGVAGPAWGVNGCQVWVGKRRVGHGPLRVGLGCELGFSFWIWAGFWVLVG